MSLAKLETILDYRHPDLIARYRQDYPEHQLSGDLALRQLIQYLWLSKKHDLERKLDPEREDLDFECSMFPEMLDVDNLWHSFLLFSKDYSDFCQKYLGGFMHHIPNTGKEVVEADAELKCSRYLSYVYDNLGEEALKNWFAKYFED